MNDLIWFSVPGAILLVAISISVPAILPSDGTVLIGLAPIVGFIVHQSLRVIFESLGGWHFKAREVVSVISNTYQLANRKDAFLVWELAFYSDNIPAPFRDHDRGAWHYILSFSSCCFAAFLGGILVALVPPQVSRMLHLETVAFFVLGGLFLVKAFLTFRSLNGQEVAFFLMYRDDFNKAHGALLPMVEPAPPN